MSESVIVKLSGHVVIWESYYDYFYKVAYYQYKPL